MGDGSSDPRDLWLSLAPGAELSGPYTDGEAQHRHAEALPKWPLMGIWRGTDPRHVQPAHPAWGSGTH